MGAFQTSWTEERTELVKRLWMAGLSAGQIALQMGGITRNAIIGKSHRMAFLGLGTPSNGIPRVRIARPKRSKVRQRLPQEGNPAFRQLFGPGKTLPAMPEKIEAVTPHRTILAHDDCGRLCANEALDRDACRWPIGDPQHADFHFCGHKKIEGLPYCEAHARRAYMPPKPRYVAPARESVGTYAVFSTDALERMHS